MCKKKHKMCILCVQFSNTIRYWFAVTESHDMETIEKNCNYFVLIYLREISGKSRLELD